MKAIYVVGTADTKGVELDYLATAIAAAGGHPIKVDIGTRQPTIAVDVSAREVAALHPEGADKVLSTDDRGTAVAGMAAAALLLEGAAAGGAIIALLAVFALARSACSVSYKDVLGKTVSKSTRGTATGTAGSIAAALMIS